MILLYIINYENIKKSWFFEDKYFLNLHNFFVYKYFLIKIGAIEARWQRASNAPIFIKKSV